MTEPQALALTSTLGALVLVVGSLLIRRFPLRLFWRLAILWAAIFAGLFLIVRLLPSIVARFT